MSNDNPKKEKNIAHPDELQGGVDNAHPAEVDTHHGSEVSVCRVCKTHCVQIKSKKYKGRSFKYTDENGRLWYSARVCPKCRAKTRRKGKGFANRKCIVCEKEYTPYKGNQKSCGTTSCKLKMHRNSVHVLRLNRKIARGLIKV